jgi:hypothetical protein
MPFYPPVPLGSRFTTTLQAFAQGTDTAFDQALPETVVQQIADDTQLRFATDPNDVYTPALTLWTFVAQVLSASKSCVAAVARVLALRTALGLPLCSANTGAYCKARSKLSVEFLRGLTYVVGETIEDQSPGAWRWHGRRVLLVDGFECTLPDTPDNQRAYPQPSSQRPGLGFPMIRAVVLLAFATASVVGAAYGPYQGKETGETALLRQLLDRLRPGDIVVADRYYCSYWMIALLHQCGVDVTFRLHQLRHYDFRRGQRLGPDDHVVVWTKPQRPQWMTEEVYASLPETLTVREVRFRVDQPGYRSKEILVATTLVDAECYPTNDIADLYHRRWHVELDIRAIKQTLRMDQLTCKTPALIERELWVHLLGYNLVRKVMAEAAWTFGHQPRQLSFAGAVQTLEQFRWLLMGQSTSARPEAIVVVLLAVASHVVGDRPGRVEPRAVKRRPKEYDRLMKPRAEARAELLRN